MSNIAKYEVYIDRQQAEVEATKKYESIKIPNDLEYKKIKGLSNEILTKLGTGAYGVVWKAIDRKKPPRWAA